MYSRSLREFPSVTALYGVAEDGFVSRLLPPTVSALVSTTCDWLEEMEAGRDICSVFLDLKKAFDTVNSPPISHGKTCAIKPQSLSGCAAILRTGNKGLWLEKRNQGPSQ